MQKLSLKENFLSPILWQVSKFSNLGLSLFSTQIFSGFLGRKYLSGRLGMDYRTVWVSKKVRKHAAQIFLTYESCGQG